MCHTISASAGHELQRDRRSRSQFEPGKTITALFMRFEPFDAEILDDRIRKKLAAHVLDVGIARAVDEIKLDQLSGSNIVHAGKAEPLERMVDGLALGVEDFRILA